MKIHVDLPTFQLLLTGRADSLGRLGQFGKTTRYRLRGVVELLVVLDEFAEPSSLFGRSKSTSNAGKIAKRMKAYIISRAMV